MTILSIHPQRDNADFQLVARSFLMEKGLPLANVLPAVEIERIFRRHDALFGDTYNSVYNTAMVRKEFWTTLLAYNLIRRIICTAAIKHGKTPRRISFTRTCATILAAWSALSLGQYHLRAMQILLQQIASLETPDRPGRIEPRVLKQRRHRYPLMRESRQKLKKHLELTTRCGKMT